MISSSCEFEERRRKESRSIFFMVSFSHRRNLYEWKKKRNKRNYVGIKENIMQEDETLQLKIIFWLKKKTNLRNGPRLRLIVYPASKQCWQDVILTGARSPVLLVIHLYNICTDNLCYLYVFYSFCTDALKFTVWWTI